MNFNTEIFIGEDGKPRIRFYDAEYSNHKTFPPLGQCIGTYYVETLLEGGDRLAQHGIDLCGHEPKWKLTGAQMRPVIEALRRRFPNL